MRILRGAVSTLGALGALIAGAVLAVRALGLESGPLVVVVAATPYAVVLAAVAAVLLLLSGSRFLLGACLVVLLGLAATQAPLVVSDPPGQPGPSLTVMTANLQYGRGDVERVVATVRERRVDVLGVQELTPESLDLLRRAGLERVLPHSYVQPGPSATGTGLWSRTPLTGQRRFEGFAHAQLVAQTRIPGGQQFSVAVVHPRRPDLRDGAGWAQEQDRLRDELDRLPGDVVAAGDFNATPDHRAMRRLSADGWHDAADQAGAGLTRTWPLGSRIPPLFALDHVIVRGRMVARAAGAVEVPGSDHSAVVTKLGVGYDVALSR